MSQMMTAEEDRKRYRAFVEEHRGLTPGEVIELSAPEIYAELSNRYGRPPTLTPEQITEFIRKYGEHPEVYVARVFKFRPLKR